MTFDAPLSTYTPFGLVGTGSQIIAPFFADVDTRGGDTVKYGWGETTFEGHRAFCVNWVNVGYYAAHTDKLNSFQLLLVQREDTGSPGDFDIVFNYGSVQWETGDASGGDNGLGGSSARAGFSNGTGREKTSYEVASSGVNGALLDANTETGLANYSTSSQVRGRHVFSVRSGGAPQTNYVALGDSYQSGEGTGNYLVGTDIDTNKCHRSANAYPGRLVSDGAVHLTLDFGACSGAKTTDLDTASSSSRAPWDDGVSQYDRLNSATKLVTIGIGGNDLDFSGILKSCIGSSVGDLFKLWGKQSCEQKYGQRLQDNMDALVNNHVLASVYRNIRKRAPYARIAVLGYPKFFVEGGQGSRGVDDYYCAGIRLSDQVWVNAGIRTLDEHIRSEARALGLQYVDTYNVPTGHELCGPSNQYFMNGVKLDNQVESYHPNAYGHSLLAQTVGADLLNPAPGDLYNVRPGEMTNYQFSVDGDSFDASTQWPGSDVVLSLTSPSGREINRATDAQDASHEVGPTFESYHVANAEHGIWTATLYGARVAPRGEETRLDIYQVPKPNQQPKASMVLSRSGRTVLVNGSASSDPDGSIVQYLWEFGDGATASGATETHTYTEPGTYLTTLAVKDNQGRWAVTSAASVVEVPAYDFTGFFAPIDNPSVVNTMKAGAAVPIKFSLGADFGLSIFTTGSPSSAQVDCSSGAESSEVEATVTAGSSGLQYDAQSGRYTYVWKTDKAWAGTCRKSKLTLFDGGGRDALFKFR